MAHQIETNGSEAAAIFARTDAWHRLGTTVRGRAFSAEEAMTIGHLGGWRVRKVPLTAHEVTADGVTAISAPGSATVRDNRFSMRRNERRRASGGNRSMKLPPGCRTDRRSSSAALS